MPNTSAGKELLQSLRGTAKGIRTLEADARAALDQGDENTYRANYHEKVFALQDLPELVEPHLKHLPDPLAHKVRTRAQGFATRAQQAESVGSIFFMYALLYPDDYQEGQPNDLEAWIEDLEQELGA